MNWRRFKQLLCWHNWKLFRPERDYPEFDNRVCQKCGAIQWINILLLLILPLSGCLNKIPAVARYQASATEKCERTHTPEECKPLPYPSEDQR